MRTLTRLVETQPFEYKIVEAESGPPRSGVLLNLEGIFQRADTKNANGRVYPRDLWNSIMSDKQVNERIEKRRMVGELDHPESGSSSGHRVSHVITSHELQPNGEVRGTLEVLDTPAGRIAETLFRAGVGLGISSRGDGSIQSKGESSEVQDDFQLETYDLVLKPSTPGAYPQIAESEEKAKENLLLIANAIEGLVNTTEDVEVLLECHKIVSVLEGESRCTKLLDAIKNKLRVSGKSEVGNGSSSDYRNVTEENEMTDKTNTPGSTPSLSADGVAFIRGQVQSGIAEAVVEKDKEIAKLNAQIVTLTTEARTSAKRLTAAESLIEEATFKVRALKEGASTDKKLKLRYEAATKIIDEAVSRLREMGELKRRYEAATRLLASSIGRHRSDAVSRRVESVLKGTDKKVAERLRPILSECVTPAAVTKRFKELKAVVESASNTKLTREPLPLVRRTIKESTNKTGVRKAASKEVAGQSYVVNRMLSRMGG